MALIGVRLKVVNARQKPRPWKRIFWKSPLNTSRSTARPFRRSWA